MSDSTVAALNAAGLDPVAVNKLIELTLDEDLAGGEDVTTVATVPLGQRATLDLVARQAGVAAGIPVAAAVFEKVNPVLVIREVVRDGDRVECGDV